MNFDFNQTIISQYANSPIIRQLIQNFADCVLQDANMDQFYNLIWNIDTAQGYGLDVWGRILGVSRILPVVSTEFFGFEEAEPGSNPWNTEPFYSGGSLTSNFALSDTAYRTLLFAKALTNICDGSIIAINTILLNLFPGRGDCYVQDGENMTMVYKFTFSLSSVELAIVEASGALPKPVGVAATVSAP